MHGHAIIVRSPCIAIIFNLNGDVTMFLFNQYAIIFSLTGDAIILRLIPGIAGAALLFFVGTTDPTHNMSP